MTVYHFLFDFNTIIKPIGFSETFWTRGSDLIGGTFLFVAGISLWLSRFKLKDSTAGLKHGLKIFGWGLFLTAITLIPGSPGAIYFGILHCIGLSLIVASFLVRYPKFSFFSGLSMMGLGFYLRHRISVGDFYHFKWVLWEGASFNRPGSMLDYYPLMPWMGLVLTGVFVGSVFYAKGQSGIANTLPVLSKPFWFNRWLQFLGRHSLLYYLVHQPILIGLIYLSKTVIY
jgi:uncharacterized membrane protein